MHESIIGLELIVIGIVASVVLYSLMRSLDIDASVCLAYCSYFLGGIAVANLQLIIAIEQDGSAIGWSIYLTVRFVAATTILAVVASARRLRGEKPLLWIFGMTIVLAILQFSSVPYQLLNTYARIYAAACIVTPLVLLVRLRRNRS